MGGVLWYVGHQGGPGAGVPVTAVLAVALWVLGSVFLLTAIAAPALAARLHGWWVAGARAIGIAFTLVVFTVLFAVFLPLFLFVRWKDPLGKRRGAASYWEPGPRDEHSMDRALQPY